MTDATAVYYYGDDGVQYDDYNKGYLAILVLLIIPLTVVILITKYIIQKEPLDKTSSSAVAAPPGIDPVATPPAINTTNDTNITNENKI